MLIRNAEVWGLGLADVRIEGGRIAAVEPSSRARPGTAGVLDATTGQDHTGPGSSPGRRDEADAEGALLLPGLHDHHIHLAGLAARQSSILCGPPLVNNADELARALSLPGKGWIRGIGYHESVMGLPDAKALDRIVADRPLRVQHRSGRLWLLNSLALEALLVRAPAPPGLDRATGHLFDEDRWLRDTLGSSPPDLTEVGRTLAAWGVTGVTDMSPANDPVMAAHFAGEMAAGRLPQRLVLAGALSLADAEPGPWRLGPAKLHLHEAALPDFEETAAFIRATHDQGRAVAIHCVSEVELVFALAVLEEAGSHAGDRIEHASVASDELIARIAALGLAVCAQPLFVRERGDAYLRDVESRHHAELYRLSAFREAGIPLTGGSDAPFGGADPFAGMAAAVQRETAGGQSLGPGEALSAEEALALYLADPLHLAAQRRIAPGEPADLCLLDRGWKTASAEPGKIQVRATWISGRLVHDSIDQTPVERGAGR